jgi:FkbM family methyltransferase
MLKQNKMIIIKTPTKIVARILWRTKICKILKFKVQKHWLHFHPSALSAALWENPSERNVDYEIISKLLRPGDCYIDIGANIGSLAIHSSQIVGPRGQVVAIEPNKVIFQYMNQNITLNKCMNITGICCGCGRTRGSAEIVVNGIKDDQGYIDLSTSGSGIRIMPLDSLIGSGYENIRLIKIDVEGLEEEVLSGSKETLFKVDAVLFEVCPHGYRRSGGSHTNVCSQLKQIGFLVYSLNRDCSLKLFDERNEINITQDLLALRVGVDFGLKIQP